MLGCLCIRKFERELGIFWRVILPRGCGLGLDRFWLGLAWLGLDRFWLGLGWLGPFLVGLAWIVFGWVGLDRFWLGWVGSFLGLTKGWRKKSSKKSSPAARLTQV